MWDSKVPHFIPTSHLQMIGLARPIYVPSGIVNKSEIDLKLPDFVTYSLRRSGDNICWQQTIFASNRILQDEK